MHISKKPENTDKYRVFEHFEKRKDEAEKPRPLVRETGLEPVRTATHAPQTCASADSATLANARIL